jgi:hypothetical protein
MRVDVELPVAIALKVIAATSAADTLPDSTALTVIACAASWLAVGAPSS